MIDFNFSQDYGKELRSNWNDLLDKFRTRGIIVGIFMIVIGVLCFVWPLQSAYAMATVLAIALVIHGLSGIIDYVRAPAYLRIGARLVVDILNIVTGVLLLCSSAVDMISVFGFVFSINLLLLGIQEISLGNRMNLFLGVSDTLMVVDGVLNIIFAVILISTPLFAGALLSMFVAFYLVVGGISLLIHANSSKRMRIGQ